LRIVPLRPGEKYHKLTIMRRVGSDRHGRTTWECLCDCGKIKVIAGYNIYRGKTKSCGCLTKDVPYWTINSGIKGNIRPAGEAAFNDVFSNYRYRATKKGINFNLSKTEFRNLINSECFYCGAKPENKKQRKGMNGSCIYNGIDRKDNELGYTKQNTVPCCRICNIMKNNVRLDLFISRIQEIYKNLTKRGLL